MLDITGDDIKELNDVDLRSLIGLLCEADLRSSHLPIAGVTWGGHQNAADGGIDVRVNLTTVLGEDGFIPRSKTGFQVKKPDMNRSAIFSEMKPNNALRDVIKELADEGGAYIIVSSQGSTADSALTSRKNAMVDALADYLNASNLKVDFYDRDRIAGWVRCHPSLILWVRDKIGRPIQGWRSYSNWTGNIEEDVYILDENLRLYNSANTNIEGLSSLDGIKGLQVKLKQPGSSVRLVGLSGVGKTRFVQALFEDSLSENALNKNQVFYTDINYSPNPDPISFAERIIALNQPGILVIDNCPPDLHNRLTTLCSSPRSLISLLTVEYDVKDDMPEETEVYRLKPSSNELIEKLVETKFPHISQVDCRTIANFSGGNARIAIALAKTIRRGESLGNLRDSELFVRLFQQRNHVDQKLQRAAEVCSLVYSFDIQTAEGFNYELKQLGSLIGLSVQDLYQCVRELQRRNLVQMRSNWRAVLPHAIAIRLARNALENIPLESILNVFEKDETGRLLKSFSKRLSFLHGSTEAKEIAKKWLSDDGLLGNLVNLNELGISLLRNIAPISPELVLNALERVYDRDIGATYFTRDNSYYNDISRLLRSLAYDENLFIQSVNLLSQIALSEKVNENNNSIRSMLKSMFTLYLSGTHASAEQRLSFIKKLIYSNKSNQTELGILLLSSALETWHFSSHYGFEFGSHSRDYGYAPTNSEEKKNWYKLFVDYTVSLAISETSYAPFAKSLLAEKFRGLWVKAGMYDTLESASNTIRANGAWREGWLAVKSTIRFDGSDMDNSSISRLNIIAEILEPRTLIERSMLYTLSGYSSVLDLEDIEEDFEKAFNNAEIIAESLGVEVGSNEEVLQELLPELLCNDGSRIFNFGRGLAKGCANPNELWSRIIEQLLQIEHGNRKYPLLRGVLQGISQIDKGLVDNILDLVVIDENLGEIYPFLQLSMDINSKGLIRIIKSLDTGRAPIHQYKYFSYGRYLDSIQDTEFCELVERIDKVAEGNIVSIDLMNMRLHGRQDQTLSETTIKTGQKIILNFNFANSQSQRGYLDYELARIIKSCFKGQDSVENLINLCNKFILAIDNYNFYPREYKNVLSSIALTNPLVFLDCFFGREDISRRIKESFTERINTLSIIEPDTIIEWCDQNPIIRYPIISSVIKPYQINETTNKFEWTSLTYKILANTNNPIEILKRLKASLRPSSWSGSRAKLMQDMSILISSLRTHENPIIVEWAISEEIQYSREVKHTKEWELKIESERNERFE